MRLAVICENNPMNSERDRCPLILLDTAIIMRLEVNGIVVLIDWIRFKVEPGRIDMSSEDIEAFSRALLSDNGSSKALALNALVNLVACF